MIYRRIARPVAFVLALALVAGIALGSHRIVIRNLVVALDGVDDAGNLSSDNGADGLGKFTYNTRTGRAHLVARGRVQNDSGRAQVYTDVGLISTFITDGTVTRDRYVVSASGRAVYNGVAKNATID
jgi:hypothetical protein